MIQNININGANVSAELHAYMYQNMLGYSGVFNYGNKLQHEIISNNEIKIKDGLLISQGRLMRIVNSESVLIENGQSGVNRCDLIVVHFETDGIKETHDIRVITGTSENEPEYKTGNTFDGDNVNEFPLYAVHLEGLNITSVDTKFNIIKSANDMLESYLLESDIDDIII